MREVVITGVGLVTPLGDSLEALTDAIRHGRSAIASLPHPRHARVAAQVTLDVTQGLSRQQLATFDRGTQLAMLAGEAAWSDAGVTGNVPCPERTGVFAGSGCGPSHSYFDVYRTIVQDDSCKALDLLRCLTNAPASQLSMQRQLRGACQTYATACASSTVALGEAMRAIRHGYLDMAIAGGIETPLGEGVVRAWESMRMLARPDPGRPEASCRPFSRQRNGVVLGEGAALFILESADSARARGARIYATLHGYGTSADAGHITSPQAAGQVAAMHAALSDARMAPSDIGYVNAHGTATKVGDAVEAESLRTLFGAHAERMPVSSTKAMHGHLLGASGAIELAMTIAAMRSAMVPATLNLDDPDPELALDFVPGQARQGVRIAAAMSNSFAFGGTNACLIVS